MKIAEQTGFLMKSRKYGTYILFESGVRAGIPDNIYVLHWRGSGDAKIGNGSDLGKYLKTRSKEMGGYPVDVLSGALSLFYDTEKSMHRLEHVSFRIKSKPI